MIDANRRALKRGSLDGERTLSVFIRHMWLEGAWTGMSGGD